LIAAHPSAKLRSIVPGGATRAGSVRNGLNEIDEKTAWIVAVHDGARPLVTVDEISQTVENASLHGAACLVADVTDTIKEVDHGFITKTVPRTNLRRALTPQAFQYGILRKAFDGSDLGEDVTDECFLVENLGIRIFCVEGNSRNIKITRPEDLKLAEMYLASD
jgi:2-C-methyl-D-erythritol 4-phosphate cytidylyltransferase